MKKIIHKLRQQPEEVKKHLLHIITMVFAVILFIVWVYSLGTGFNDSDIQAKIKNEVEPLSALKDNFINGLNSIQDNSEDNSIQDNFLNDTP